MVQQSHFWYAVYIKEMRTLLIVVYMRDVLCRFMHFSTWFPAGEAILGAGKLWNF